MVTGESIVLSSSRVPGRSQLIRLSAKRGSEVVQEGSLVRDLE